MAIIPGATSWGRCQGPGMPTGATPPSLAPDKDSLGVVQVLLAADVA